jgi:catechol 2,3-dioxygenase-like lactoylglutathione lyase family enzyme
MREADDITSAALGGEVPYRFHHVGVRVASDRAADRLRRTLGLEEAWANVLEEHDCRCHFCEGPGLAVEFVVPLSESSSAAAIPHALHHIGVEVPDIATASAVLARRGFELTDERPLEVVDRYLVNFIAPLRFGFMLELVEDREAVWQ